MVANFTYLHIYVYILFFFNTYFYSFDGVKKKTNDKICKWKIISQTDILGKNSIKKKRLKA